MLTLCLWFLLLIAAEGKRTQKPKIEKIAEGNFTDNPFYYDDFRILFFTDVLNQTVNAVNPITKKLYTISFQQEPSVILPINGTSDQFILSLGRDLVVLDWNYTAGTSYYTCLLVSVDSCCPGNVWAGGFAGGRGRFIGGTRGPPVPGGQIEAGQGTLYVVDTTQPGKAVAYPKLTNQKFVRSIAFLQNNTVGFLSNGSDSVFQFTYDLQSSNLSNIKPVFNFTTNNIPCITGGLATDTSDNLWVAGFGCGQIFKFNTTTLKVDQIVNVTQAPYLTNVVFGGVNEDEMFVTSGTLNSTTKGAGGVFRITNLGVQGFKDNLIVVNSDCTPVYTPSG